DIWADPATGLPLRVAVTGRGARDPFLVTRFLQVSMRAPDPGVLELPAGNATTSFSTSDPTDLLDTLSTVNPGALPDRLAGQERTDLGDLGGIGAYGTGLARFLVLPVPRRTGFDAMRRATRGGGAPLTFPYGEGVLITTPLLSVLAMDS